MCGIGAVSSPHPHLNALIARVLARALEHRGPDATGFAWSTADGSPWYWKMPRSAKVAVPLAPLEASEAILVHTRFATNGSPDVASNNHPVVAPGLALVHNGVISNDADLLALVGADRVGEVDSYAAAALLSYGPDALDASHPVDLLGFIEGRAALAWLDSADPHVVHLARCSGSPLVTARIGTDIRVAASTEGALRAAARAVNSGLYDVKVRPEGTYLRMRRGKFGDRRDFIPGDDLARGPRLDQGVTVTPAKAKAPDLLTLWDTVAMDRATRRGALLFPPTKKDGD